MGSEPRTDIGRLARLPAGRRSAWVVVTFWLVAGGIALGPAGLLPDAEENDAISWLPEGAESTRVILAAERFQPKDQFPAVVVYDRPGGVTPDDLATVTAQAAELGALGSVPADPVGPIPSTDGAAAQVTVPIDAGSGGWDTLATTVDEMRAITADGPSGLAVHVTGPGGYAADSSRV